MPRIINDKTFFFIQNLIKYIPFKWAINLRRNVYKPFFIHMGKNVQIKDGVTFKYPSETSIGNNSIIGEYCYLVGKGGLTIKENALIGAGSKIVTTSHNYENIHEPMIKQGLNFRPIFIDSDVWLGFNVVILQNTTIGKGVIVGAGSVVTKNIEPYSIVAGVPAKIIKKRK